MKRKWIIALAVIIALMNGVPVLAAEYHVTQKEAEEGQVYSLTYSQTYDGMVEDGDLARELEYDGKTYHLTSAEIEYGYGSYVQSNPEDSKTETILLNGNDITQIPKYKREGNMVYVLDESSIMIQVTGYTEDEGADVIRDTRIIEKLPDNDLNRIPMQIEKDGITCDLLYVTYNVTGTDKNGIANEYKAECFYGGLDEYTESFESSWQAVANYKGYSANRYIKASTVNYEYQYIEPTIEEEPEEEELTAIEEPVPDEPEDIPEPKPVQKLSKIIVAATGATAGIFLACVWYVFALTAPIYAMTTMGVYKRIGRIRIKNKIRHDYGTIDYEARLTEFLAEKAEVPSYKIKVPERIRKRSTKGVLLIKCPNGDVISPKLQSEVTFTLDK